MFDVVCRKPAITKNQIIIEGDNFGIILNQTCIANNSYFHKFSVILLK